MRSSVDYVVSNYARYTKRFSNFTGYSILLRFCWVVSATMLSGVWLGGVAISFSINPKFYTRAKFTVVNSLFSVRADGQFPDVIFKKCQNLSNGEPYISAHISFFGYFNLGL